MHQQNLSIKTKKCLKLTKYCVLPKDDSLLNTNINTEGENSLSVIHTLEFYTLILYLFNMFSVRGTGDMSR
jgi:hypothetical protein